MFWRGWFRRSSCKCGDEIREIRAELQAIRALLEQPLHPPSQASVPAAPSATRTESAQRPCEAQLMQGLNQLLNARKLHLNSHQQPLYHGPLDAEMYHLGFFMSQHYPVVANFLAELRATLDQPRTICFPLPSNISVEERSILTNVATRLYQLRILTQYRYDRARGQITAKVDVHPELRNYLSGGWFEMGVFQAVHRRLARVPALLLRDVHLLCDGGGNCELDILIYLHNGDRRLILLECKSGVGGLKPEEIPQVRRAVSLLNLGIQRAAVVMPEMPAAHLADRWMQQTGASIISFAQLDTFLLGAVA